MRIVKEPGRSGKHFECLGNHPGHCHAEALNVRDGGGFLGKLCPLLAVVILGPLHLDRDETLCLVSKPVREKKNGEPEKGKKYQKNPEGQRLASIEVFEQVCKNADDNKVDSHEDYGEGIVKNRIGRIEIDAQDPQTEE